MVQMFAEEQVQLLCGVRAQVIGSGIQIPRGIDRRLPADLDSSASQKNHFPFLPHIGPAVPGPAQKP